VYRDIASSLSPLRHPLAEFVRADQVAALYNWS